MLQLHINYVYEKSLYIFEKSFAFFIDEWYIMNVDREKQPFNNIRTSNMKKVFEKVKDVFYFIGYLMFGFVCFCAVFFGFLYAVTFHL
jgi:hypothetical protein